MKYTTVYTDKRTVHVQTRSLQSAAVASLVTVGGSAVAAWCVANDVVWHLAVAEKTLSPL